MQSVFLRTLTEKVAIIYRRNRNEKKQKMCANLEYVALGLYGKKYKKIKKRLALLPWIRYTKRAVT